MPAKHRQLGGAAQVILQAAAFRSTLENVGWLSSLIDWTKSRTEMKPRDEDLARVRAASARVAQQSDDVIREESRRIGPMVSDILRTVRARAVDGVTTAEIAAMLVDGCRAHALEPAMLGYNGFPFGAAVSVNDEIVHGIPSPRVLRVGDLVKVQLTAVSGKAFAAQGWTFAVVETALSDARLMTAGRKALREAIASVAGGRRLGDIGAAIQSTVEAAGFTIVRAFVGYGMGKQMILPPQISGTGRAGTGQRLRPGAILNLHVILKPGTHEIDISPKDKWTTRASDGERGALFTAMVEVTADGAVELTRAVD